MEVMVGDFDGRIALVTGSGRGIGRAIAVDLARGGASVILVARSADQLAETAAIVAGYGAASQAIPTDLGNEQQLESLLQKAGDVDILVNNAAVVAPLGASASIDVDEWAAALQVNVVAAARLTFGVLPAMLRKGWGRIVNVSAVIAAQPAMMVGMNAYATSKAALEAHTLNMAAELSGSGVTVNVYRPGAVDTAIHEWIRAQEPERIGAELHSRFIRMQESGQLITPTASARSMVDRLAQDITGQIWDVNDQV